jgi:lipopolysaccharide/colanic/teichoic acid biosynthesis glycosyltransferase
MEKILKKYEDILVVSQRFWEFWIPTNYKPARKNMLELKQYRILKRGIDLVSALFLAVLILPWLIPIIAILIKLESKGPVFFIQKRTGLHRNSFYCIKFRSMYVNGEANRKRVVEGDERITKLGYFLRKFFIDEIPQLLNVIRGDMSMVGPRPFMLWDNVHDSKLVPNYHDRHKVKPGLTGLAQMRGYHGTVNSNRDLHIRLSSDLEYIENWVWYKDLFIIFGTMVHVLKNAGCI